MGGWGSGRCRRGGKKATAEESLVLGIGGFHGRLCPHAGTVTWTRNGTVTASVGYFVTSNDDRPILTLHYRQRETDVRIPIRLQPTYPAFGGQRWWFTCPLIVNGVVCNRRVGKLYLPPGTRYFGCRTCHRLAYLTSQSAHQFERFAVRLGFPPEAGRLLGSPHVTAP